MASHGNVAAPGGRERLFRRTGARPFGDVLATTPPSLPVAAAVGCAALALLTVTVTTVQVPDRLRGTGVLMPATGIADVRAPATGRLRDVRVAAGQSVREGDLLALLDRDIDMPGEGSLASVRQGAVDRQRELVLRLGEQRQLGYRQRRENLERRRQRLMAAHGGAESQATLLEESVSLAKARADRYGRLAGSGGVSEERADDARQSLVDARYRLEEQQARMRAIAAELAEVDGDLLELSAQSAAARIESALERQRLDAERAEFAVQAGQALRAPVAGTVLRVYASGDSSVRAGARVFALLPAGGALEVWIYLPARQVARLAPGTSLELMVDALPHQQYGTLTAHVVHVGQVALMPGDPSAATALTEPAFELRAGIAADDAQSLVAALPGPGASFTADLIRERVPLLRWLLRAASR